MLNQPSSISTSSIPPSAAARSKTAAKQSETARIITIHPKRATPEGESVRRATPEGESDNHSTPEGEPTDRATPMAPTPILKFNPLNITVRLGIDRVVFLITDLPEPPELDVYPVTKCEMRFHMLPGLLLNSPERHIVCPFMFGRGALPVKVQLLSAAMENENPYFGLSLFAKVVEAPNYTQFIPEAPCALLPLYLVKELFPQEASELDFAAVVQEYKIPPDRLERMPVRVNFEFPTGYDLPEIYRRKIIRISLSLYARAGGLAPNGAPLLVNSRSRPTLIHVASSGFDPSAADYYQLRGIDQEFPATSALPDTYEDYSEVLDPTADMLARRGFKF